MVLPLTTESLLAELKGAREVLDRLIVQVVDGVPGQDLPAAEGDLEAFLSQLCGELLLVAGKCQTVSEILGED